MSNTYYIRKKTAGTGNPWADLEPAQISNFPWDDNGYRPKAYARAYHTGDALYVKLNAVEHKLKAVYGAMNEPVYTDSCLEFFIMPDPEHDGRYMNFELNPLGTLLLGLGEARDERLDITEEQVKAIEISTSTKKTAEGREWSVELCIPFDFLRGIFPKFELTPNKAIRGNFYKCGDETEFPHFGCWNPITLKDPDFHVPPFFGALILE